MNHVIATISVLVLMALKVITASTETCKLGKISNQCIDNEPPCGYCGEYISITIIVTNTLVEPKFLSEVRVEKEPQQTLFYFLQLAVNQNSNLKFSSTYYAKLGFMVDTINKVTANVTAQTYWRIISVTSGNKPLECGVSSYIPVQGEVILFNFTTWSDTQNEKDAAFPQCIFGGCS
ncbi:unnamed protein product [Candidula unifasciata]|uniref:DUF4430 domain-containing protein n=1 Tax=Candidula unifasciata TaxID=100452 RepID=A0A8S3ZIR0_9EUPU|nr:unnamed protein product [Candidula unifasciata]